MSANVIKNNATNFLKINKKKLNDIIQITP